MSRFRSSLHVVGLSHRLIVGLCLVGLSAVAAPIWAQDVSPADLFDDGAYFGAEGLLSSSNTGTNAFNGLNINTLIGTDRFYSQGYTGSRAVVTNVEGGHVWNGHETLTSVSTFLDARGVYTSNGLSSGRLGQADRHATWVGQTMAGRSTSSGGVNYQRGIAYGATLWSGAIATDYGTPAWSNSWGWTRGYAFTNPYETAMQTGVAGRRTDVVNSSWGLSDSRAGSDIFTLALDGMARANRTTVVLAAGNEGPTNNTIRNPASGYNAIVVGATAADTDAVPFNAVASFSSRGPQDYSGPDGSVAGVRARVDILAPGQNITLAFYGGLTGGNVGGTDSSNGATNFYTFNAQGTSFAAPIIAGSATLLCDVAYDRFASNSVNATDGRVIKAVLLNSARKLSGWNNGQTTVNGVVTTTQALDFAQGAGEVDLNRAFDQFTGGTTDVAGLGGGTNLSALGWDYGQVFANGANDYFIGTSLLGGSTFTATLNWFVDRQYVGTLTTGGANSGGITANDLGFVDLDLELWSVASGAPSALIAKSNAAYINTEHFSFLLPSTGLYMLRVGWQGERYDILNNINSTNYGLAWSGTAFISSAAPEPGTLLILVFAGTPAAFLWLRRSRG